MKQIEYIDWHVELMTGGGNLLFISVYMCTSNININMRLSFGHKNVYLVLGRSNELFSCDTQVTTITSM